jgi:hypothetical protein
MTNKFFFSVFMSTVMFNCSIFAMEDDTTEILSRDGIPYSLAACMDKGTEENVELTGSEVKQLIRLANESRTGDNVHGLGVKVKNLESDTTILDDKKYEAVWRPRKDVAKLYLIRLVNREGSLKRDMDFPIQLNPLASTSGAINLPTSSASISNVIESTYYTGSEIKGHISKFREFGLEMKLPDSLVIEDSINYEYSTPFLPGRWYIEENGFTIKLNPEW